MRQIKATIAATIALNCLGMVMPAMAQDSPPIPPWLVKFANNQEMAARQCQIQLAQEQAKSEDLTKQLGEARAALAKTPPATPPGSAAPKKEP